MRILASSLAALFVAGAAIATPAAAQDDNIVPVVAGAMFTILDGNGDGIVDPAEIDKARLRMFDRLDDDGDGKVTAAERDERMAQMKRRSERMMEGGKKMFSRLDANKDGAVTREEYLGRSLPFLPLIDIDGDGSISRVEFDRVAGVVAAMRGNR